MPLDFSLLGQGPQFGNVLQAYDQGRQQRKANDTQSALALYATDPEAGISAIRRVDPVLSMKLQDDYTSRKTAAERKAVFQETDPVKRQAAAQATGDPDTITASTQMNEAAAKMDDRQRAHAKELTNTLGGFLYTLRHMPMEQRQAAWQQAKPHLLELNMPAEKVNTADLSDGWLDSELGQAQTFDQALKRADQETDNRRLDDAAAERVMHDREMERLGGINAGANVTRANRPPASGGAKLPPGFILD